MRLLLIQTLAINFAFSEMIFFFIVEYCHTCYSKLFEKKNCIYRILVYNVNKLAHVQWK